ncbi:4073_t:CDS:2 [Entrophospora sp. SA101]|nr:4073_t:CDS:2 [Entrophospora sp. SA101]
MLPYGERNNSRKHVCMYYRYFNRPTSKEINEYFGKYDYEKRKDYQLSLLIAGHILITEFYGW